MLQSALCLASEVTTDKINVVCCAGNCMSQYSFKCTQCKCWAFEDLMLYSFCQEQKWGHTECELDLFLGH